MSPRFKTKAVYGLAMGAAIFAFLQMGFSLIHQLQPGVTQIRCAAALLAIVMAYTIIGMARTVAGQLIQTRRLLRAAQSRIEPRLTKQLNKKYRAWHTPIIVVDDQRFEAMTVGLIHPKIIISTGALELLTVKEAEAVLLHEYYHCRNRDNLKLFLLALLARCFRYLPVVRPVHDYYRIWTELFADRYAIGRMGTSLHLGQVLLKLVRWGIVPKQTKAVHAHFAEAAINYRMLQIADPEQAVQVRIAVLRPFLLSCCFMLLIMLSGSS